MSTSERYRRTPGLVMYWAGSQPVCFVWQTQQRVPVSIDATAVLQQLSDWSLVSEIVERVSPGGVPADAEKLLRLLLTLGLVEREGDTNGPPEWHEWAPEAAFFHFGTKNGVFPTDLSQRDRELVEKAVQRPPPVPTKRMEGPRQRVPEGPLSPADLESALAKRRTWRRFSDRPVPLVAFGTVLSYTFGVRGRGHVPNQGPIVLRTSPSGGSRHPMEAYVLAWNVDGLTPGVYHYDSAERELVDLRRPFSSSDLPPLLAHQTYFARAAGVVVMCAVFPRMMWRYGHSRAYRTVLIDTGHLGQTFCLTATALGLAPFTTMAFSESAVESLLRIDGVLECPLYVAGVGMPDPAAAGHPGKWTG